MATTAPAGPVYVCLDAGLQESRIGALPQLPPASRFRAPAPAAPDPTALTEAAELLSNAQRPLIFAGRNNPSAAAWNARIQLAEALGGIVLTAPKPGPASPTAHQLHGPPAGNALGADACALVREADVVLSLDWVDLAGALRTAWGDAPIGNTVILA